MSSDERVTNFFGEEVLKPEVLTRQWFYRHYPFSIVGAILLLANFPKLMSRLIDSNVGNASVRAVLHAPIQLVQGVLATIIGANPIGFFERSMAISFFLIGLFLILLAAFSVRRRGIRMLAYGLGGILAGILAVHAIAYGALFALFVAKILWIVAAFVVAVLHAILYFLFHDLWPVLLGLAVLGAAYFLWEDALRFLRLVWFIVRRNITKFLALAALGWLVYLLYPIIYRWIIAPIIAFLQWLMPYVVLIFGWIALVVGGLLAGIALLVVAFVALAFVGSLAVTQLQAGWHAARSQAQALKAGIAIGSALALIVLVSAGTPALAEALDHAWSGAFVFSGLANSHIPSHGVATAFVYVLPESVRTFTFAYLTNLQAPALDSFLLLATASAAGLSVLFRLFSNRPVEDEYVPIHLLVREYGEMMLGVFALLFLVFASSFFGDSHSG